MYGRLAQLVEYLPYKPNVWEISAVGRVPALQAEGHRFESYISHQFKRLCFILTLYLRLNKYSNDYHRYMCDIRRYHQKL